MRLTKYTCKASFFLLKYETLGNKVQRIYLSINTDKRQPNFHLKRFSLYARILSMTENKGSGYSKKLGISFVRPLSQNGLLKALPQ